MSEIILTQLPPLSLYIHMPWCIRKCPYCDFNSHQVKGDLPEMRYIDSLIRDLELILPLVWGRSIQTIFIGGGTPSLFSGNAIDYLLAQIRARISISPYAEITMEANPGTIEQRYISEYAAAGVNRISLGIQSFNDQHLQMLGRIHSAQESIHAIESVAQIFDNFNLDIIYGLPQQSLPQALDDIQQAISFSPTHISAYNLTLEPNTEFAKHIPLGMPDNDLCYEMQDQIIEQLAAHNYQRYEISAFAKPRHQTQHNLNYWRFGDYLGIGAGAHAKISFPDKIIRQQRHKHPEAYMQKTATNEHIIEQRTLGAAELPFEFMLGALRLIDGFENKLFSHSTGLSLNKALPQLIEAQKRNLIDINNERIKPTQHGLDFQNNLLEMFLN